MFGLGLHIVAGLPAATSNSAAASTGWAPSLPNILSVARRGLDYPRDRLVGE